MGPQKVVRLERGGAAAPPRAENFLREGGVGPRRSVLCLCVCGHLRKVKEFNIFSENAQKAPKSTFWRNFMKFTHFHDFGSKSGFGAQKV